VSRRLITIFPAAALACALAAPALAQSAAAGRTHVIAQKSATKGSNVVILSSRLTPGHKYRIEMASSGKFAFSANGFENYTYFVSRHVAQRTKPFSLKGSTPYTHMILPPISAKLSGWSITVQAIIIGKHPLTVRYRDLGATK
jgi:hypothetical protein